MSNPTEIRGLKLADRLGAALRGGSYPVLSFYHAVGGMVLALARIIGELSPFGVAFAAAVPFRFTLPAMLGVVLGYLMGGGMARCYRYVGAVLLVTVLRWLAGEKVWNKRAEWLAPLAAGSAVFLAGVLPALYSRPLIYDVMMWIAQVVIAGAAAAFLRRGLETVGQIALPRDRLGIIAAAVMLAMALMGLDALEFSGVTLGRVAAAAAVLVAARVRGESWATLTGVVCGLVMGFSTGDVALYVTAYSLGGLLAGVFAAFGRLGSTLAFTVTYGFIGVLVQGSVAGFIEVALAAAVFLMIPASLFRMAASAMTAVEADDDTIRTLMEDRIMAAAQALEDVSVTTREVAGKLQAAAGSGPEAICDQVAERVCRQCVYCRTCWQAGYSDTMDALGKGLELLRSRGSLGAEDFPRSFCKCVRKEEVARALAQEYQACLSREGQRRRAARMRALVTEQFDGLAMALRGVVEDVSDILSSDRVLAAKLREVFLEYRLEPREVCCWKDREGHMAIRAVIPGYKENRILWEPLLRELEEVSDLRLSYPRVFRRRQSILYTFYERPRYAGEYGSYQLSCEDAPLCGDTFRILTTGGHSAHIILSDGMGSGKNAAVDSAMAASLTARLLDGGIGYQSALKLINSALLVKSGEESLATLDAARIDLFTGRVRMFKAGAAPTLLLKKGRGVEIESASLPAGILSGVEFQESAVTLEENDLLVMISDGAAGDGCDWILRELESNGKGDLNELCRSIAQAARLRRGDGRADDITVVACRLVRGTVS